MELTDKEEFENLTRYDFFIDIYGICLHMFVGEDTEKFREELLDVAENETDIEHIKNMTFVAGKYITMKDYQILWVDDPKEQGTIKFLMHELIHFVSDTCASRNLPFNPDPQSEEVIAYLFQHIIGGLEEQDII